MQLVYIGLVIIGFCICLAEHTALAHILVYRLETSQLVGEFNDLPAQFGPVLPSTGLKVYPYVARPIEACERIRANLDDKKYAAIIARGGNCTFELKVRHAQAAGFYAAIIFNNISDDLEQMSAKNSTGIRIQSVFIGQKAGRELISINTTEYVLVINDELPFNINTQLILPFSILIGLCFLIMIFYMVYKCIREERRLRRYRLPKRLLKKLPIIKYAKNNDLAYETCVICLEDFVEGDKLRVLPCRHPYHSYCIDPWLTENRRVCPICKRKVFTKGEARRHRNRQSSLDSVTDTDDDTTPLLQPTNATQRANAENNPPSSSSTHHGTFRRSGNGAEELTSDDDNVLSTQPSSMQAPRRINPFDRTPNLPPHLVEQLNENRRPHWFTTYFRRLFRRQESISVAAPPFLEEVLPETAPSTTSASPTSVHHAAIIPQQAPNTVTLNTQSNGSFKGEHDTDSSSSNRSIYEPTNPVAVTNPTSESNINPDILCENDAAFIQTPSQGGIGVAALPNNSITTPESVLQQISENVRSEHSIV